MIRVDISGVISAQREAARILRGITPAMRQIGNGAAAYSRNHHLYRNRTGMAEANTVSVTEAHDGSTYMLVTIGVPYGSYLMKGGTRYRNTSLTELEDGVEQAERELDYLVDGTAAAIGAL